MKQNIQSRTPSEIGFGEQLVLGGAPYDISDVIWEEFGQTWKITYGDNDNVLYCKDTDQLTVLVDPNYRTES